MFPSSNCFQSVYKKNLKVDHLIKEYLNRQSVFSAFSPFSKKRVFKEKNLLSSDGLNFLFLLFRNTSFIDKWCKLVRWIYVTYRPLSDKQFLQAILRYCNNVILWQSDSVIKWYWKKAIIFFTKYCFCFSKSAEITMNRIFNLHNEEKKYCFIAISLYLFIAILLVKIARLMRA
jgi:hypothetical protein